MCVSAALSSFFFFETSEYLRQLIRVAFVAADVAATKTGKFARDSVPVERIVFLLSQKCHADCKQKRKCHDVDTSSAANCKIARL